MHGICDADEQNYFGILDYLLVIQMVNVNFVIGVMCFGIVNQSFCSQNELFMHAICSLT